MGRLKKTGSRLDLPSGPAKWRQLEVDDAFFTGADVGGFLGLEELAPPSAKAVVQERPAKRQKVKGPSQNDGPMVLAGSDAAAAPSETASQPAVTPTAQTQTQASTEIPAPAQKKPARKGKKRVADTASGGKNKVKESSDSNSQESPSTQAPEEEDTDISTTDREAVKAWDFSGLHPQLLKSLARLGFTHPTPIQQRCLPTAIWDGRDIVGAAQTGSGKTLAFGLPILQAILAQREKQAAADSLEPDTLQALIFAPTRELAMQVCEHLQAFAKPAGVWVVPVVGGMSVPKQRRLLANKPPIVVATPGRLWELLRDGEPHLATLASLRFLVLDEADRMVQAGHFQVCPLLDLDEAGCMDQAGHFQDLALILEQIPGYWSKEGDQGAETPRPSRLQTFIFSATLTLPQALRKRLHKGGGGAAGSTTLEALLDRIVLQANPKIVDLTSERKIAAEVSEAFLQCSEKERDELLYYLIAHHSGRTLVFTNAISGVRRLAAILSILKLPVYALHAGMQQRQRLTALDRFKASPEGVLVATDVAARGLDIPVVATVVHYQLPASADMYVHRSGRTGRAGAEGTSIALITPKDAPRFAALLQALQRPEPPRFPIDMTLQSAVKKRMQLALRIDASSKTGKKAASDSRWQQRMAKEMDLDISDNEADAVPKSRKGQPVALTTPQLTALQQELAHLLQEPLQAHVSTRFFAGQQASSSAGTAQPVHLAAQLAASRQAGQASQAKKRATQAKKKAKSQLTTNSTKNGTKRRRGLVVPLPFGRPAGGAEALAALKQHIARL